MNKRRSNSLTLLLLAATATLSGCLKAREVDRAIYDPQSDQFRLVMVLENISGGTSDLDYLDALRKNKDHLIAPCMPGDLFGNAPWFLRLADHKTAKVTFTEPRPGDLQPIDATASLAAIDIRPGAFFVQDNQLCYYHAVNIPGKTVDAIIEQTRKEQLDRLKKQIKSEIERRKNKGRVHTWQELISQEVAAIKNNSTDHPITPFMVMEEDSLNKIATMTGDVKKGLLRKGKDFTLDLPMTAKDRDGLCELWGLWVKAADATADKKKDNPMFAMQRLPAQSITITSAEDGVVVTIDAIKLYNSFAQASLSFLESSSPQPKPPTQPASEVRYAQEHHWPLEENLATAQILKDFTAGTLKIFPSESPFPPGTGLKVQPKK